MLDFQKQNSHSAMTSGTLLSQKQKSLKQTTIAEESFLLQAHSKQL